MVLYQERAGRLYTGAKLHPSHKKVKDRFGTEPIETKIGENKMKFVRVKGGNTKVKAYKLNFVNVSDPKTKTTKKATIKSLFENSSSIDFQRRSILTKGAVVVTDLGKVRITSRPGQVGILNGILLPESE